MQRIINLPSRHIFVFGSNRAGLHGAGAAADAKQYFRAKQGYGEGIHGRSYALPTKGYNVETLSLDDIRWHVEKFLDTAASLPYYTFVVTPVGCGLAGYTAADIGPMFKGAYKNVVLPDEFLPYV